MLNVPAPFPHPGAAAFVIGTAQPCRIIQRRADGLVTIALAGRYPTASSTRTVELAELAATAEDALAPLLRRRRRAKAKTKVTGVGRA